MEAVFALFMSLIKLLFNPLNIVLLILLIILVVRQIRIEREYKESAYYQITKHPYLSMKRDLGKHGEYLTYKQLKHYEADGAKFLFNIYIPKGNGETTEIDVLMIYKKGLFVFESKNYSGWIFGDEKQKNWYQTLPSGRGRSHKESFFNPIMQNQTHIKHLKAFLGESIPTWSFIVFSERCTLKNVHVTSSDIRVVNRYDVVQMVDALCYHTAKETLSEGFIERIYNKLYPYSQVDEVIKQKHVYDIHNKLSPQPSQNSGVTPVMSVAEPSDELVSKPVEEKEPTVAPKSESPQVMRCPICNGTLVLRKATRGANAGNQFYGCLNYPKCKYIKNITILQ